MSAAVAQPTTSGSRSRPQARKKINDDAAYFGPPPSVSNVSGTKRQAADKAEGEPRVKRKRPEPAPPASSRKDVDAAEQRTSLVEFNKLPLSTIHKYLTHFDIIPSVFPSPLSPDDPPSPVSLGNSHQQLSRPSTPPAPTPANRPRRESKEQSRRRSSRLLEEETRSRAPVLADIDEVHDVLATLVERHFRESTLVNSKEEVDMLASFMCAVEKAKGYQTKG